MSAPSAAWPVDTLVGALARSGWGDLAGRGHQGPRNVLRALVDVLPHGSASGLTTAHQLADTTGLSERWVRRCLHVLEGLGVITWVRGGVRGARAVPSCITIAKRVLVTMIRAARRDDTTTARQDARRQALAARVAKAGRVNLWPRRRPQPELTTAPPSSREEPRNAGGSASRERTDMLPHTLREFVGPHADTLTPEQERRIMRAEEAASAEFPGPRDGHMRRHRLEVAVRAILAGDDEPITSLADGAVLDYRSCDVCSRPRQLCESIPMRVSGHTFVPRRTR